MMPHHTWQTDQSQPKSSKEKREKEESKIFKPVCNENQVRLFGLVRIWSGWSVKAEKKKKKLMAKNEE